MTQSKKSTKNQRNLSNQKRTKEMLKKNNNKVTIQKLNTHVTMPESQPTPDSIGLSQAQH